MQHACEHVNNPSGKSSLNSKNVDKKLLIIFLVRPSPGSVDGMGVCRCLQWHAVALAERMADDLVRPVVVVV